MYVVAVFPRQPKSSPRQLVDALVAAKQRGVDVKVYLDQNFDDDPQNYTHSKLLVIDNKVTVFGSTNWRKTSITRNNETMRL